MTDPKQPHPAPAAPKMIRARVVTNYGNAIVGATVTVAEGEYLRLREPDGAGGHVFPVLISQADADALAAKERAAEEKRIASAAASDTDRATGEGWAEYQRKAGEILAAQRIEEQRRQQAILTGAPMPALAPAEAQRRFNENVAAGRGA